MIFHVPVCLRNCVCFYTVAKHFNSKSIQCSCGKVIEDSNLLASLQDTIDVCTWAIISSSSLIFLNKIGLFQRLSENTSLPTAELVLSETHITAKWHALPDTSTTQRKCTIALLQILAHHNYICIMSTNLDKTWLVGTSPWLITTASPKALYANDGLMHFETWFECESSSMSIDLWL